MARNPVSIAAIKPNSKGIAPTLGWGVSARKMRAASSVNPPTMAGIDSINENRAAVSRVKLRPRPAAMVEPERDMPGIIAIACIRPISSPSRYVMAFLHFCPSGRLSAYISISAVSINEKGKKSALKSISRLSPSASAIITAGKVAVISRYV